MVSNSKLTPLQKSLRKAMLSRLPQGATFHSDSVTGITILAVPDSTVTRFYSSVMSGDEQKFRRKVGEFYALVRWDDGQDGFMLPGFWNAGDFADRLV